MVSSRAATIGGLVIKEATVDILQSVRRAAFLVNVDYRQAMALMGSTEAAARLGVKKETLYAYVSRGLLERHHAPDGRGSLFDRRAVETLARRGRPRQSSRDTSINLLIQTRLTSIADDVGSYRGHDARSLARTHTFEEVAEFLWTGRLARSDHPWQWPDALAPTVFAGPEVSPAQRIRIAVATASTTDTRADDLSSDGVAVTGRRMISSVIESLPTAGDCRVPRLELGDRALRSTIAGRLWTRLSPRRPKPGMIGVLNAALVLMADHELAASTLAARVAATTRATPYGVVAAGLGTLSGPLHGGVTPLVLAMFRDAETVGAERAVSNAQARDRLLPGFGHKVYVERDPRAETILSLLRTTYGHSRPLAIVDDVAAVCTRRSGRFANVDLALAAMAYAGELVPGAEEVVFSVARIAGWLAHAIEEYSEAPLRFRPRASYIGQTG